MILVAPTAFKGTLSARAAARAMAAGVRRAAPQARVRELPLSDGGPGLLDALRAAWGGELETVRVSGPLGEPVEAPFLRAGRRVVVESAAACGLHLIPPEARDPMRATTYGVGELIRHAVAPAGGRGGAPEELILGLGGSGTVDGGIGMAQALGWRLLDLRGRPVARGGAGLLDLSRISRPAEPVPLPSVTALADVNNPLLGERGAAAVYGPQKGAGPKAVRRLELGLARLAVRLDEDLGCDVRGLAGAGAAGGLGAAARAFLGAELAAGSAWVLGAVGFAEVLRRARLVVTGEGSYDVQSAMGKITGEVVRRARARGVPVLLVAGRIETPLAEGVTGVDGAGQELAAADVEARVAEAAGRLLG